MKQLLLSSLFFLFTLTVSAQAGSTYVVVDVPAINYQWGNIIPTTGTVNNVTTISTNLILDNNASCMNNQNGLIYFFENYNSGAPTIVTLDVTSGAVSKQAIGTNPIAVLEYSSVNGKVYIVQENGSNIEWGEINPATGVVSNTSIITTPLYDILEIDLGGSCIDEDNEIIYFMDYDLSGNQYIVTLNVSTNTSSKQLTSQEIRYIEFHNVTGKLYTLTDNGVNVGWAEINPTNGAVTNFTAFPVPIVYIDDLPGTCFDHQNGIFYFSELDFEGALTDNIVGINVNTGVVTKQSTSYALGVLEHWNSFTNSIHQNVASETSIEVFPNPFTNQLKVTVTDGSTIKSIGIYTITGQQVLTITTNENVIHINEALEKGTYILEVTTKKDQIIRKKIISN